jgi:hypothetical protein
MDRRRKIRKISGAFVLLLSFTFNLHAQSGNKPAFSGKNPVLLDVVKIWDGGEHNAFTDLIRFRNAWYCVFRESSGHQHPNGRIRIISSADGVNWKSVKVFADSTLDLRDPKICVTPKGRLMVHYVGVTFDSMKVQHFTNKAHFSVDGMFWSSPRIMVADSMLPWRITWHNGFAYSIGWNKEKGLELYKSKDGIKFNSIYRFELKEFPNEATIVFKKNGDMTAIIRKENQPKGFYIGRSKAPYTEWEIKTNYMFAGGPDMIYRPDSTRMAAYRSSVYG